MNASQYGEYRSWSAMKYRCFNVDHHAYHRYGGRGITVCDSWKDSFFQFLEDMGPRPEGGTIDRIDNNGNYEPGNCRWSTRMEQNNNRNNNHILEHDGQKLTISQWSRKNDIHKSVIRMRIGAGWSASRAVTQPVRKAKLYELNGLKKPLKEWCKITEKKLITVTSRMRCGWSFFDAITIPVKKPLTKN